MRAKRSLHVRDRLRVLLDERRWRDYTRVPGSPSFFYRAPICAAFLALATAAHADPCEAPLPKPGAVFSGPVRYVGDGDSLCVAGPQGLIEVRVADFYSVELNEPGGREAKARAERALLGRNLVCRAGKRSFDRVVAWCTLNGRPLRDVLRGAGVEQGGRGT
jgi:micrococcal nuclease